MPQIEIQYIDVGFDESLANAEALRRQAQLIRDAFSQKLTLAVDTRTAERSIDSAAKGSQRFQKSLNEIAKASKSLGTTSAGFQELSKSLGLTDKTAAAAIASIKRFEAGNVSASKQAAVLAKTLGINQRQFDGLRNALGESSKQVERMASAFNLSLTETRAFVQTLSLTEEQAGKAASRLNQLAKAGASTEESFSVLTKELGLTRAQFDQINAAATFGSNLQSQLKSVNQELAAATREADRLSARLEAGADVPDEEVARVATRLREAETAATRLSQEFGVTNAQAKDLAGGVDRATAASKQLSDNAGKVKKDFTELNLAIGALATGLAAGIGSVFRDGASAFLSFEEQSKTFGVIAESSGAAQESIAAVNAEAQRLGASSPKTASEVAGLSVELARAGFTADEISESLEGVVSGSVATGEDLSNVGSIVGAALNQFGEGADQAQRVVDLLVVGSNNSATSVGELGEALKEVGSTANANNQSLEGTTTILGLLANAGITGGRAGTALSAVFRQLNKASVDLAAGVENKASKALAKLGVDARDANGNLRPMLELLPELQAGFNELDGNEQAAVIQRLFGDEGAKGILPLLQASTEDISSLTGAINNADGAALAAGEALRQGLTGALAELGSAFEGTASIVFGTFAPAAELLVRTATQLLSVFNNLPGPIQAVLSAIAGFTGLVAAAVAAVAGYNLVMGAKLVAQAKDAATLAVSTTAQAARTVATTLATAKTALLTLATTNANVATLGLAASTGTLAVALGGAVAAAAIVANTFNEVTKVAGATRDNIQQLEEELIEIEKARLGPDSVVDREAAANAEQAVADLNAVERALDGLRNLLNSDLNPVGNAVFDLLGIDGLATAAEAQTNRASIAFSDLIDKTGETEQALIQANFAANEGLEIYPEQVEALVNSTDSAIAALEREKPITEEQIKQRNAQISRLQALRDKLQETTGVTAENTEALDENTDSVTNNLESLSGARDAQIAEIARDQSELEAQLAEADLSPTEAQERALQNDQDFLNKRLANQEEYLASLRALEAEDPGNAEVTAAIVAAETERNKTRTQIAENGAEQQKAAEEARVKAVEEALDKQRNLVEQAEVDRQKSLNRVELALLKAGASEAVISAATQADVLANERAAITDRIALKEQELAEFANDEAKRREILLEISKLEADLGENEVAQERAVQERIRRLRDQALEDLDRQGAAVVAIYEEINASIDRQNQSLQIQAEIIRTSGELQATINQGDIDDRQRALDLVDQLNSDQVKSAEQRRAIEQQLADLGFDGKVEEKDILQEIIELEAAQAQDRLAQVARENELSRIAAELDAENQRITAARAVSEAEINALKAEQNLLTAQQNLLAAQQSGNAEAIELAQRGVDLANSELALSQRRVEQANANAEATERNIENQRELNNLAAAETEIAALRDEQQAARQRLDQAVASGEREAISAARSSLEDINQQLDAAEERANQAIANTSDITVESVGAETEETLADSAARQAEVAQLQEEGISYLEQQVTLESRLADEAQRRAAAYAQIQSSTIPAGAGALPSRRVGGSILPGQPYQLHSNEIVVPITPSYVLNEFDSRAARKDALRQATEALANQMVLNPTQVIQRVDKSTEATALIPAGVQRTLGDIRREVKGLRREAKLAKPTIYQHYQAADSSPYEAQQKRERERERAERRNRDL